MKFDGSWSRGVCLALLGFSGCSTIMGYDDGTLLGGSDTQHLGGAHSGGAYGDSNALGNLAGALAGGQTGATSNQSAGTEVNPSACSTAAAVFAPLSVSFAVGTDLAATGFVPRDPTNTGLAQIVSTPANLCSAGCLQMSQTYFVSDGAYTRSISLVMPLGGTSYSNLTGAKIVVGLAVDNPQSTPLFLSIFATNANGSVGQAGMNTAELAGFALTSGVRDYVYSVTDTKDESNRRFCASSVTELGIMLQNSATITAASAGTVNVYVQSVSVSPSEGTPNAGVGGANNPPATNQAGFAGAVGGAASTANTLTSSPISMGGEGGFSTSATSPTMSSMGGLGGVAATSTQPSGGGAGGVAATSTLPSAAGTGGVAATSTPSTSHCGNGVFEPDLGEECDDARDTGTCNGVSAGPFACKRSTCGDGYANYAAGEECEVLNGANSATCNGPEAGSQLMCKVATCGDYYVNGAADEKCDDGPGGSATCNGAGARTAGASTANRQCLASVCGDGYVSAAAMEQCEPTDALGNPTSADSASCNGVAAGVTSCQPSTCGDGYINRATGEECDPGPGGSIAGCMDATAARPCTIVAGYSCWSALTGYTACSPTCGDSQVVGTEACDDGNKNDGDGCSSECKTEAGWTCPPIVGACSPTCGDSKVIGPEVCDDGDTRSDNGCASDCRSVKTGWICPPQGGACSPKCGDGTVISPEVCDDGDTSSDNGCSSDCRSVKTGWTCPSAGGACTPPASTTT